MLFNHKDRFAVALEGTRSKVQSLKTGFYHIAVKANIPIIKVGFDFSTRQTTIDKPFYPSGDVETDMLNLLHLTYCPVKCSKFLYFYV